MESYSASQHTNRCMKASLLQAERSKHGKAGRSGSQRKRRQILYGKANGARIPWANPAERSSSAQMRKVQRTPAFLCMWSPTKANTLEFPPPSQLAETNLHNGREGQTVLTWTTNTSVCLQESCDPPPRLKPTKTAINNSCQSRQTFAHYLLNCRALLGNSLPSLCSYWCQSCHQRGRS